MAYAAPAPIGIAPRYTKPPGFNGTDVAWRVLCDLYANAETPEIIEAVVEYCATRKLDPLRKPVHVVPMYNARLKRRVQVVMQGITELETTAHRTGQYAGLDEPIYGPMETRKFAGEYENDDGTKRTQEVEMSFPEWASVTVYRLVDGEKCAFSVRLWWIESYGSAGFRSEVPTARWQKAPRQMLGKCCKAAALRAAFPEEVGQTYTNDEMEGQTIEAGGVTIDGTVDHGEGGLSDRDRRPAVETPPPRPSGGPAQGLGDLNRLSGDPWLRGLYGLLRSASTLMALKAIQSHRSVQKMIQDPKTPSLVRQGIEAEFRAARDRLIPEADILDEPERGWSGDPADDPIAGLLDEIAVMDQATIDNLRHDQNWASRRAAATGGFPPDEDRLDRRMEARRNEIKRGKV